MYTLKKDSDLFAILEALNENSYLVKLDDYSKNPGSKKVIKNVSMDFSLTAVLASKINVNPGHLDVEDVPNLPAYVEMAVAWEGAKKDIKLFKKHIARRYLLELTRYIKKNLSNFILSGRFNHVQIHELLDEGHLSAVNEARKGFLQIPLDSNSVPLSMLLSKSRQHVGLQYESLINMEKKITPDPTVIDYLFEVLETDKSVAPDLLYKIDTKLRELNNTSYELKPTQYYALTDGMVAYVSELTYRYVKFTDNVDNALLLPFNPILRIFPKKLKDISDLVYRYGTLYGGEGGFSVIEMPYEMSDQSDTPPSVPLVSLESTRQERRRFSRKELDAMNKKKEHESKKPREKSPKKDASKSKDVKNPPKGKSE